MAQLVSPYGALTGVERLNSWGTCRNRPGDGAKDPLPNSPCRRVLPHGPECGACREFCAGGDRLCRPVSARYAAFVCTALAVRPGRERDFGAMPDERRYYEMNAEPGAFSIEGKPLGVSVSKQISVTNEGYRRAVQRLRKTIDGCDGVGVYISVTEAVAWASSLADRAQLKDDPDFSALNYARDRSHHQWASIVEEAEDKDWKWRTADQLPTSTKEQHQGLKDKLPNYKTRLEGRPILEVFERLTSVIGGLDS